MLNSNLCELMRAIVDVGNFCSARGQKIPVAPIRKHFASSASVSTRKMA